MRRIAGAALAAVGFILAIVGIAMATIWRPGGEVAAETGAITTPFVCTDAGVLDLVSSRVTITAKANGDTPITLVVGYAEDIAAWSEGVGLTRLTGLESWDRLATTATPASVESVPSLVDSDLWLEKKTGVGTISVTYKVVEPGAVAFLAQTAEGNAPEITLTWQRSGSNEVTFPLIFVGIIVAVIGALLVALDQHERKRESERLAARKHRAARRASRAVAETAVIAKFDGNLAESSREIQMAATGHTFGAGVLVASPRSRELRERPLAEESRLMLTQSAEPDDEPASGMSHEAEGVDAAHAISQASTPDSASERGEESPRSDAQAHSSTSAWRERWKSALTIQTQMRNEGRSLAQEKSEIHEVSTRSALRSDESSPRIAPPTEQKKSEGEDEDEAKENLHA